MDDFYQGPFSQETVQQFQQQLQQQQQRQQRQHQQHQHQLQHITIPQSSGSLPHGPHTAHPSSMAGLQPDTMMTSSNLFQDMAAPGVHGMHRRRSSVPHVFATHAPSQVQSPPERRMSVMEFGSSDHGFDPYQFSGNDMHSSFQQMGNHHMGMSGQMANFGAHGAMGDYSTVSPDIMSSMIPETFAGMNMDMGRLSSGTSPIGAFAPTGIPGPFDGGINTLHHGFGMDMSVDGGQAGADGGQFGDSRGQFSVDDGQFGMDGGQFGMDGGQFSMDGGQVGTGGGQFDMDGGGQFDMDGGQLGMDSGMGSNNAVIEAAAAASSAMDTMGAGAHEDTVMAAAPVHLASPDDDTTNPQSLQLPEQRRKRHQQQSSHSPPSAVPTPTSSMPSNGQGSGSTKGPSPASLPNQTPEDSSGGPTPASASSSSPKAVGFPVNIRPANPLQAKKGPYTKSGFDCMTALMLVATRKKPELHIGAVDMSCAFVICDVKLPDCPIVYVSPNFQNLTGYHSTEILGKNCRFLQAPDGKVEAGSRRQYVDDSAVYNLKDKIAKGKEVQQSLINYRKGGKPFLNLLTMIPIPWDTDEIRYFVGFQIDIVESPQALSSDDDAGGMCINYTHNDLGPYIWTPPQTDRFRPDNGQTLGEDDVSTLLQHATPSRALSEWHRQSWDKMLLENTDDLVHVVALKGTFIYASPACRRLLEWDAGEMENGSVSQFCHPSDLIAVERTLKDAAAGGPVNFAWRVMRKHSGYTWVESHGSLFTADQGKGRKCVILVGRQRPVIALSRRSLEEHGGIGDTDIWTKLSTSGMFLFVSANIRSLLDHQPPSLVGTSIQEMMRPESRPEFGRAIEKARKGKIVSCKHEVQHKRGQVMQALTILYPGDVPEGQKPSFIIAQTKLVKASSPRTLAPATTTPPSAASSSLGARTGTEPATTAVAAISSGPGPTVPEITRLLEDARDNLFDELSVKRPSSWQYELRQMEMNNRILADEVAGLLTNKKKRKRRKGTGNAARDCANCHTRNTPEWRRGPSGDRDLCNSCGLRWAKQMGRVSPRTSNRGGNGESKTSKPASVGSRVNPTSDGADDDDDAGNKSVRSGNSTATNSPDMDGEVGESDGDETLTGARLPDGGMSLPPLSQPLLGGSNGGSSGSLTAIQEERDGGP